MTNSEISLIPKTPGEVAKAIAYLVVAVVAILRISLPGGISPQEIVQASIMLLGLVPVWWVAGTKAKALVAAGVGALQALAIPLVGALSFTQVTLDDWLGVLLAGAAVLGVTFIPNTPAAIAQKVGDVYNVSSLPQAPEVLGDGDHVATGVTTLR